MKCTNCGQEMHERNFCIFCGYMKNGNFISKKRKETLEDLERYLDKDYQKVLRNETYVATFLGATIFMLQKVFCYRIPFRSIKCYLFFISIRPYFSFRTVFVFMFHSLPLLQ